MLTLFIFLPLDTVEVVWHIHNTAESAAQCRKGSSTPWSTDTDAWRPAFAITNQLDYADRLSSTKHPLMIRLLDDLRLEVWTSIVLQQLGIHVIACCHLKAPHVPHLQATNVPAVAPLSTVVTKG